ncbi:hypothetical protein NDU88_005381 [Pleurodeles waltl]|uniref:EF-hand domain-containing protein n=1 Tax=Pleurodeles waltl TaxID=8319 RepID=A0AAV7TU42_PLEWA|nr:hypothetical protein NDU88_005381 [Pleurodeles waltl]
MGSSEEVSSPELRRLFSACDVNRSGRVEFEDFSTVCRELGVSPGLVRPLFSKLDVDRDGAIDFQDFSARFQEVSETLDLASFGSQGIAAWGEFEDRLGGEVHDLPSREQLCEVYQQIHATSDFGLLQQYERMIEDVARDFRAQRLNMEKLESVLKRSEEMAAAQLAELEEDLQQQLINAEHKAQEEERQKVEATILELQRRHQIELSEMQSLIDRLHKSEEVRKATESKDESLRLKDQVYSLTQENEHLTRKLLETQTNVALLHTELDKLKNDYTDQQIHHEREKEMMRLVTDESRGYSSHIEILQAANKSLYDSNDSLRSALVTSAEKERKGLSSPGRLSLADRSSPNMIPVITHSSYMVESDYGKFSDVADWADRYLDSGVSMPQSLAYSDEDDSPSDVDSDCTDSSEDIATRSGLLSDLEGSDYRVESRRSLDWNSSRPPSHCGSTASSRKRLPAFTRKKEGVTVEDESQGPCLDYRLVLAGDAGSGKSSFMLRLCLNEFRGQIPTTLGVDFQIKKLMVDGEQTTLQIWDTAGQERFRSIAKSYFRKAHGVLLLYDVTSESSFLNVREWIDEIKSSTDKSIPVMVIGNKIDLREEMPESGSIRTSDGEKLARAYSSLFCETSAKEGTNVVEAVLHLAREVKKTVDLKEENKETITKLSIPDKKKILPNCCNT